MSQINLSIWSKSAAYAISAIPVRPMSCLLGTPMRCCPRIWNALRNTRRFCGGSFGAADWRSAWLQATAPAFRISGRSTGAANTWMRSRIPTARIITRYADFPMTTAASTTASIRRLPASYRSPKRSRSGSCLGNSGFMTGRTLPRPSCATMSLQAMAIRAERQRRR